MRRPVRHDHQISLRHDNGLGMAIDPDQGFTTMGKVKSRHVPVRRHSHAPRFGEARSKIESPSQGEAGEDVAQQVQHDQKMTGKNAIVQFNGRSDRNSGFTSINKLSVLGPYRGASTQPVVPPFPPPVPCPRS